MSTETIAKEAVQALLFDKTSNLLKDKGNELFEAIWGNNTLKENLFPETVGLNANDLINIKPSILTKFKANISNSSNTFYNFIKVK